VQSQVRFNRVLEKVPGKVPEKVPGSLGAKPSQVQQGSGQTARRSIIEHNAQAATSGKAKASAAPSLPADEILDLTGDADEEEELMKLQQLLEQSASAVGVDIGFGSSKSGDEMEILSDSDSKHLRRVQQGSGEGSREGSRKPWCKAKSGSTGSREGSGEGLGGFGAEPGQVQQGSGEGSGEGLGGFGAEPG